MASRSRVSHDLKAWIVEIDLTKEIFQCSYGRSIKYLQQALFHLFYDWRICPNSVPLANDDAKRDCCLKQESLRTCCQLYTIKAFLFNPNATDGKCYQCNFSGANGEIYQHIQRAHAIQITRDDGATVTYNTYGSIGNNLFENACKRSDHIHNYNSIYDNNVSVSNTRYKTIEKQLNLDSLISLISQNNSKALHQILKIDTTELLQHQQDYGKRAKGIKLRVIDSRLKTIEKRKEERESKTNENDNNSNNNNNRNRNKQKISITGSSNETIAIESHKKGKDVDFRDFDSFDSFELETASTAIKSDLCHVMKRDLVMDNLNIVNVSNPKIKVKLMNDNKALLQLLNAIIARHKSFLNQDRNRNHNDDELTDSDVDDKDVDKEVEHLKKTVLMPAEDMLVKLDFITSPLSGNTTALNLIVHYNGYCNYILSLMDETPKATIQLMIFLFYFQHVI